MRARLLITAMAVLALMMCLEAQAVPLPFFDDFSNENGGRAALNYNNFTHWNVLDGTVDLIGNGNWDFYPGNGLYVDLDGTANRAGVLQSKDSFWVGRTATYDLSFDLGGSYTNAHPGESNTVDVAMSLGTWSTSITLGQLAGMTAQHFTFDTTLPDANSANLLLSFHNLGGDNVGLILDNVRLDGHATPELGTWMLLVCTGLVGILPRLRRRRQ